MSSAARAYQSYGFESAYAPSRPDVRVTRGRQTDVQSTSSYFVVAHVAAVIVLVMAVFAAVHVWLDSASVTYSVQAQNVATELSSVRHQGSLLEVEVSSLANPARIQAEANALGMVSPEAATVIRLSEDVVVTNGSGNLSLAGSVRVLANAS